MTADGKARAVIERRKAREAGRLMVSVPRIVQGEFTNHLRVIMWLVVGCLLLALAVYLVSRRLTESQLFYAAARGDRREVTRLLAKGARGTFRGVARLTPLHAAVISGDVGALQVLIEGTDDVDLGAEFDMTPLHLAAALGRADVVEALLEARANIKRRTHSPTIMFHGSPGMYHGLTPLHCAAGRFANFPGEYMEYLPEPEHGHAEIVRALLERGADVNAVAGQGDTALHEAVGSDDYEMVVLLVKAGAKLDARTGVTKQTPADIARHCVDRRIPEFLASVKDSAEDMLPDDAPPTSP